MTTHGDFQTMTASVRRPARRLALALGAALALPLAGCSIDTALQVNDPDIVRPADLTGSAGASSLRAGALGNVGLGYSGNNGAQEGVVLASGLFADEYYSGDTFSTRQDVDFRGNPPDNATQQGTFRNIQNARESARVAAAAFAALPIQDATTQANRAEMLNLEAYAIVLIAEIWCSGIPFTTAEELATQGGGVPLTTTEAFELAITKFQGALAASTDATQQNLARVGIARAQLNLGRFTDAAATAAQVPTGFVYQIFHSITTGRQENGVTVFNWLSERWSVPNVEGVNGLPWHTDPRTAVKRNGGTNLAFDNLTPQFDAAKYSLRNQPIVLASGLEARLIEAEALAQANNPGYLAILNALRTTPPSYAFINRDAVFAGNATQAATNPPTPWSAFQASGGLPALTDPGTAAGRVTQLFNERAYWMFGTAHRLGDLRRLVRQYGRAAESVFPTGSWHKGGSYGTAVNFPIPIDEQNNPNVGAAGIAACNRQQA